mgnify:CR=1 FL=1|tara:strand:- start:229 stop:528 length:300 start_codon:yes stop_codon:yes gene_type:complete
MSLPKNSINLIYIRAAIEAATGVYLELKEVRRYLLEEGLITSEQARKEAKIFRGYTEFYDHECLDYQEEGSTTRELNFEDDSIRSKNKFGEENYIGSFR